MPPNLSQGDFQNRCSRRRRPAFLAPTFFGFKKKKQNRGKIFKAMGSSQKENRYIR